MSHKRISLLLIHGWGFGPGFWRPLIRHLHAMRMHRVDLGFFSNPRLPEIDEPVVVVGHSMGLLWLLRGMHRNRAESDVPDAGHQQPLLDDARTMVSRLTGKTAGWIAINSFSRFGHGRDYPAGIHPRIVERMIRRLKSDAPGLLDDFRRQGGFQQNRSMGGQCRGGGSLDISRLQEGLTGLMRWDARSEWNRAVLRGDSPVLVLAARDDLVVPPALTEASFAAPDQELDIYWCDTGGHVLPWNQPVWCAEKIHGFLGGLSQ